MNSKVLIIILMCISFVCAPAFCDNAWHTIESNYFTIEYEDAVNLKKIAGKLDRRGFLAGGMFGSSHTSAATPEEEVAQFADGLLKRAEETLDMYPLNIRLTLRIFKDTDSLGDVYFRMFGSRKDYEAFYVHSRRTIYTSEYSMSDSVIIHEIAHAIADNYFSVKPPSKVSELLATYVDMHCDD